jgi:hypothetical protein
MDKDELNAKGKQIQQIYQRLTPYKNGIASAALQALPVQRHRALRSGIHAYKSIQ